MATNKWIDHRIQQFLKAIPNVENGCPIKDYINEYELYEVTCELAKRLGLVEE